MPTLHWIGKEKVINHHQDVPFRVLEHSYSFDSKKGESDEAAESGNKIIHGDNLEALKSLLPEYEGKIKCIYIDPPYNTGNENWVYNDNVNHPKIKKWLGEVVGKEGDDLSRHDKWLCMMYPRLKLLHKLLADDGAIFISIDDNEHANLKLLLDEIFGLKNYISTIACINNPKGRSDDKYVATAHESIVIYGKSKKLKIGGFKPEEHIIRRYNKRDKNGRYRDIDLRKTGDADERKDRPNMFYPFYYNKLKKILLVDKPENISDFIEIYPKKNEKIEGRWRWGNETAKEMLHLLCAKYMPKKKQWSIFEKDYLDEESFVKPTTNWNFKDVNSERGSELFIKYLEFNKNEFPNPKPLGTIKRIIQIATNKDDLILDSFAGSGTTAHAVLNLNKEDGGNRKFILVEMEDYADSITAERVKRVMKGYGKGKNKTEGTGGSFDYYELGKPLFNEDDLLNEDVSEEKIREYVWYSETKSAFPKERKKDAHKHLLGSKNGTDYYFFYEKDSVTTLNHDFLATITQKADQYVIYADNCLLSKEFLQSRNIIFKKIPRDITRI